MPFLKKAVLPLLAAALLAPATISLAQESGASKASKDTPRKPVTVTSDTMEASTNENRVVFKGNVVAVEDFTLCSDELQIMYDNNKEVSQIEAAGSVRIFQGQKTSTSNKAVYDRKERIIVLTGDPLVRQCSDTIKGDRITVYLDKDNALVESGDGGRVKAVIMPDKNCPENKGTEEPVSEEARCKGTR